VLGAVTSYFGESNRESIMRPFIVMQEGDYLQTQVVDVNVAPGTKLEEKEFIKQ